MSDVDDADPPVHAVILDFLPQGRTDDRRPQSEKSPIAYALGTEAFRLYRLSVTDQVGVGDRVLIEPRVDRDVVEHAQPVTYDDLSGAARAELTYAVNDLVDMNPERFVSIYNDAQPISLRLHQLNLLPGIGEKLRNDILDQRKRRPFESFDDLKSRVSGLHDPRDILVDRILEEFEGNDIKYRLFVRGPGRRAE